LFLLSGFLEEILANHRSFITSLNISCGKESEDLPYLHWIPKLHKTPYLTIHYIIQRGATFDILINLTCSFLYSHETNHDNYQVILVKLSAGINNLLHREEDF
jgi:hypothetical protein